MPDVRLRFRSRSLRSDSSPTTRHDRAFRSNGVPSGPSVRRPLRIHHVHPGLSTREQHASHPTAVPGPGLHAQARRRHSSIGAGTLRHRQPLSVSHGKAFLVALTAAFGTQRNSNTHPLLDLSLQHVSCEPPRGLSAFLVTPAFSSAVLPAAEAPPNPGMQRTRCARR